MGWSTLNLVSISLFESKSSASPVMNDSLGNITSASAAIEPVAPESKNKINPILKPYQKNYLSLFLNFLLNEIIKYRHPVIQMYLLNGVEPQ